MKAVGLWLPPREGEPVLASAVRLTRKAPRLLRRWRLPREGALEAIPREAGKVHWVVGLPGEVLAFRKLFLPFSGRRLTKALPYALEEHLPDDVENLCLAYLATPKGKGSEVRVWAVQRDVLEDELERLGEAGIDPEQVVPQELAPWYAYGERLGDAWLFEPASPALLAFEKGWPAARHAFSFPDGERFQEECRLALEAFARHLDRRGRLHKLAGEPPCPAEALPLPFPYDPPVALACAARFPAFNLRMGPLAHQGRARRLRHQAMAAAMLASLGLAALALELDIRAHRLEEEAARLGGELEGILQEVMPGARAVDVPHQLGRRLAQVEGQASHPPLELLAASLAVRPPPGLRLTRGRFKGRDILWEGEGDAWQVVNAWKMALERSGRFASVVLTPRSQGKRAVFTLRLVLRS